MKVVFPLDNLSNLAGATRVLLAIADITKKLGHDVTVVGDKSIAHPTDKTLISFKHYELEQLNSYYPLETLEFKDLDTSINILSIEAHETYINADIVWTFSAILDRLEDHIEVPDPTRPPPRVTLKNHWSYQHWPISGDYPHPSCTLYANSTYTKKAVENRWGRPAKLLHPPIPLDRYNPTPTYEERDTDIIYIGRVDPLKLGSPPILKRFKDLNILMVGAENTLSFPDYHPDIPWIKNATIQQLTEELSKTKIYVHWKGLINKRDAEHFGIVVVEAIASGIPTIVPKVGGPWTDIADRGKYCIGVNSVKEAIQEVYHLIKNREHWEKWHLKAIEGAKRFDYSVAEEKLKGYLAEVYTEG